MAYMFAAIGTWNGKWGKKIAGWLYVLWNDLLLKKVIEGGMEGMKTLRNATKLVDVEILNYDHMKKHAEDTTSSAQHLDNNWLQA